MLNKRSKLKKTSIVVEQGKIISSCEYAGESKTQKLLQLKEKLTHINQTISTHHSSDISSLYSSIQKDGQTISQLFDSISSNFDQVQNSIEAFVHSAENKLTFFQQYLFKQLDEIKNKQLDLIEKDIEQHLKDRKKVKKILRTPNLQYKMTKKFDSNKTLRKVQQTHPMYEELHLKLTNLKKALEPFLNLDPSNLCNGSVSCFNLFSQGNQSPQKKLKHSNIPMFERIGTNIPSVKCVTSLISSFSQLEQHIETRKQPQSGNSEASLLLPTSSKVFEETQNHKVQQLTPFRLNSNENLQIQNSSQLMKKFLPSSEQKSHILLEQSSESPQIHIAQNNIQEVEVKKEIQSIVSDEEKGFLHRHQLNQTYLEEKKQKKLTKLVRVKSLQNLSQLPSMKFQLLNGQEGMRNGSSLYGCGSSSRRVNPMQALKEQQQRFHDKRKKITE